MMVSCGCPVAEWRQMSKEKVESSPFSNSVGYKSRFLLNGFFFYKIYGFSHEKIMYFNFLLFSFFSSICYCPSFLTILRSLTVFSIFEGPFIVFQCLSLISPFLNISNNILINIFMYLFFNLFTFIISFIY